MGSATPFRIDLFDNTVDSIRTFDPETQISLGKKDKIEILPGREFPLTKSAINHFKNQWHLNFPGKAEDSSIYRDISKGLVPAGLEYYLGLFFEETASIFDHLPEETRIFSENIESVKNKITNRIFIITPLTFLLHQNLIVNPSIFHIQ